MSIESEKAIAHLTPFDSQPPKDERHVIVAISKDVSGPQPRLYVKLDQGKDAGAEFSPFYGDATQMRLGEAWAVSTILRRCFIARDHELTIFKINDGK